MTESIIEIDEDTVNLFNNYNILVDGNNALQLGAIEPFKPVTTSPSLQVISYQSKVEELADKTHQAAAQLRGHYDRVADSSEQFIPYWSGERSFSGDVELLPEIERRDMFESFSSFYEKNGLGKRIEISQQLKHLNPFFDDDSQVSYKNVKKSVRGTSLDKANWAAVNLITGAVSCLGLLGYSLVPQTGSGVLFLTMAYGVPLSYSFSQRDDEESRFTRSAHSPLVSQAKKADEITHLIKELSD